ncbi:unnamed protein product [Ambrosiozyma monospora]|uniref:Unnamed protein product n=1 Tax=Ambrosiozyma monospora TaxID=43982 RepID=A0ACB5SXB5_AMBMO|nr:unnamed protein product [Ambrosiozyma monospora]
MFQATSKNIQLSVTAKLPTLLNLSCPLGNIPLIFETSTQFGPKDLEYNGESTRLGEFHIIFVKVNLLQHLRLNNMTQDVETVLFEHKFLNGEAALLIDIKDFKYDSEAQLYRYETTLGSFFDSTDEDSPSAQKMHGSLLSSLKKPVMPDIIIGDYFSNTNKLQLTLTLTPEPHDIRGYKVIQFKTTPTQVVNHKTSAQLEQLRLSRQSLNIHKFSSRNSFFYVRRYPITPPSKIAMATGGGIGTIKKDIIDGSLVVTIKTGVLYKSNNNSNTHNAAVVENDGDLDAANTSAISTSTAISKSVASSPNTSMDRDSGADLSRASKTSRSVSTSSDRELNLFDRDEHGNNVYQYYTAGCYDAGDGYETKSHSKSSYKSSQTSSAGVVLNSCCNCVSCNGSVSAIVVGDSAYFGLESGNCADGGYAGYNGVIGDAGYIGCDYNKFDDSFENEVVQDEFPELV